MRAALKPGLTGLVLAGGMILVAHNPMAPYAVALLACFLAFTACVYPGALLAQEIGRRTAAAELAVGAAVFAAALLSIAHAPEWLIAGYALHGGWDWLHHSGHVETRVALWFPPACAVYDFAIAAFVAVAF